ncbi:bifunctional adenosylcobinamide kinase/adenosylcobinamide-phosphate guanylyltransferase [Chloroflexota bacterium]
MNSKNIFILGGARSGKSRFAQELAENTSEKVLFVATAQGLDHEMMARIQEHRRTRPKTWRTLEAAMNIGDQIMLNLGDAQLVLVDCLTLLVSNVFSSIGRDTASAWEKMAMCEVRQILETMDRTGSVYIIISNEVGMGLVPDNPMGREYRDILGKVNQLMASRADTIYFMIAGIPVKIKG